MGPRSERDGGEIPPALRCVRPAFSFASAQQKQEKDGRRKRLTLRSAPSFFPYKADEGYLPTSSGRVFAGLGQIGQSSLRAGAEGRYGSRYDDTLIPYGILEPAARHIRDGRPARRRKQDSPLSYALFPRWWLLKINISFLMRPTRAGRYTTDENGRYTAGAHEPKIWGPSRIL